MTRALPEGPGAAAGELLAAWREGAAGWCRALDRAARFCSRPAASGGADEERRELLAAIVEELRGAEAATGPGSWGGLLAHLAASATLY